MRSFTISLSCQMVAYLNELPTPLPEPINSAYVYEPWPVLVEGVLSQGEQQTSPANQVRLHHRLHGKKCNWRSDTPIGISDVPLVAFRAFS